MNAHSKTQPSALQSARSSRLLPLRGATAITASLLLTLIATVVPCGAEENASDPEPASSAAEKATETAPAERIQANQRMRDRLLLGNGLFPSTTSGLPGIQRGDGTRADLHAPPIADLMASIRQREYYRSVLGEGRWRDLERARFDLHLMEIDPTYGWNSDIYGPTDRYDRVSSTFRSNFGKLVRNWVEQRVGFSRFEDDRRASRNERYQDLDHPRLRISPRASFGHDTYVGVKLRLAGTQSQFISRLTVSTRQYFDSGATNLRLQWDDGISRVALQHTLDDEIEGDVTELYGTWSF